MRETGNNALRFVVQQLERNDSPWQAGYRRFWPKLPGPIQNLLPSPKPQFAIVHGANAFHAIGTNSLSSAIALLQHQSPTVQQAAAWGICTLRRQSPVANEAIPALTTALSDPDPQVRFYALLAFKEIGADASNAVPAMTTVLTPPGTTSATNADFYLRAAAASALGKIGPPAVSAVPSLKAALQQPNPYLRGQAATAIWRISGDVDTALPALLRELPLESEHSKWDWIIALGEMGSRATSAVPQLKLELTQAKEAWVLDYVTNALKKIDPQSFPGAPSK
jgi:HEAT repeat protein